MKQSKTKLAIQNIKHIGIVGSGIAGLTFANSLVKRYNDLRYYEKLNYAVGESHEPGSTFKVVAFTAALEDKVIDTATVVDTKLGSKAFYGRMITDTKGHGKISAAVIRMRMWTRHLMQNGGHAYK